ncbi:hypothetical protein NEOCIP111885_00996 [Pseudoneobacillus rhizosphaerae]|uniref:Uncharacterized protein n=1 Tax=Pseudoneobacillus rhizosphaerae TaxID=2880968 RepID=A0A9C7L8W4_9BACI|nr:hypothetical protein NEOCIP111885_00996 [Pseudoneobacillus rhizosphaerae]
MWFRALMIGFFSISAASMFLFQGIEFYHAFVETFKNK